MSEAEAAPAAPPVARIVAVRPRSKVVELDWPIEYDGKTYAQVTVSRMSAQQVSEFITAAKETGNSHLPMFDVPHAVIDALDPDDAETVEGVVQSFLPRAFKTAANELTPATQTTTSPSQPQP